MFFIVIWLILLTFFVYKLYAFDVKLTKRDFKDIVQKDLGITDNDIDYTDRVVNQLEADGWAHSGEVKKDGK